MFGRSSGQPPCLSVCMRVCVSVKVLRHGFKVEVRVSGLVKSEDEKLGNV